MLDPMIARLGGCLVFAGLFGALIAVVAQPQAPKRDVSAAAEIHHRVASSLFARP
ncbi:hypothetical protein [Chenggangzhangella methanolivorans]|uniref:Uncharacterized protein n=1 Tax=Chenggangzhangella methanolivorans TaxID=1437009 RepID=A0A9E6R958_9HYPH|nr:hypothetical protein [Chenggangzhangella methanolivorans]QZO00389.1 hypothetical protein K6K41_01045 [Chenggangzhangella methanolivorans]